MGASVGNDMFPSLNLKVERKRNQSKKIIRYSIKGYETRKARKLKEIG